MCHSLDVQSAYERRCRRQLLQLLTNVIPSDNRQIIFNLIIPFQTIQQSVIKAAMCRTLDIQLAYKCDCRIQCSRQLLQMLPFTLWLCSHQTLALLFAIGFTSERQSCLRRNMFFLKASFIFCKKTRDMRPIFSFQNQFCKIGASFRQNPNTLQWHTQDQSTSEFVHDIHLVS